MSRTTAATSFIGRKSESAELLALAGRSRLLTLIGTGGSGKSRLAADVVDALQPGYGDRCWSVEVADCHDPLLFRPTVATAVGMGSVEYGRQDGGLSDFFGTEPGLLLLDNCEHLVAEAAELVAELIDRCPQLTVLVTSRFPLGIAAEVVYQVAPMRVPEIASHGPVDLHRLVATDAVALFVERARAAVPAFAVTGENARAVAAVVSALDGIPLAVELAAARLRLLSPEALLSRLGEPLDVLAPGPRDAAERHRTLEASVDWSYQLCTPRERALWRQLSVFAGGFDLEAAEAVCAGAFDGEVLNLIGTLVDQSVIGRDPTRPSRYQMLRVIRHFGVRRLIEAGEEDDVRRRHLDWCRSLAEELAVGWFGPDQVRWADRIRAEHANVRLALEYSLAVDPESGLRLFCALDVFWVTGGHYAEGGVWNARLQGLAAGPGHLRARVIALEVCRTALAGRNPGAAGACEAAEELLAADPDAGASGLLAFARGMIAIAELDRPLALEALQESSELFAEAGEEYGRMRSRYQQALALLMFGQPDASAALARDLLAASDAVGELHASAYGYWILGMHALSEPDRGPAEDLVKTALDRAGQVGDQLGTALFLEMLAWVVDLRSERARAAGLVGAADAVWRAIGMTATSVPQIAALIESGLFGHRARAQGAHAVEYARAAALSPADAIGFALGADVADPSTEAGSRLPGLTRRESEIARRVAEGLSNRAIANVLHLSERTVQGHVQSILRKSDFGSRVQIASWVVRSEAHG